MGVTAAVVVGSAIAGGVASAAMAPKPPKMPKVPEDAPVEKAAADAADRQRKKNAGAYGRSDTILTGPQGVLGSSQGQGKTLLGG